MKPGDEVIYSIRITGLNSVTLSIVQTKLNISERLMVVTDDSITIPRYFTYWRGDEAERHFQNELKTLVGDHGHLTFDVRPWQPAPDYPRGEL